MNQHYVAQTMIIVASILLAGCKGDVLDYRNAQVVNGKVYAGDANTPFSGKVTNVPVPDILNNQPGYQRMMQSSVRRTRSISCRHQLDGHSSVPLRCEGYRWPTRW
ncbi:hypothetical protein KTE23_15970 [Burkholderia multivorans]|uniref:hypothetical protein n=1 Tax=Burkholderia multivorans TaxID=87883 RepID=UPI001C23B975|nr:hypothetical protein [Burkholderia multivorans]MBU9418073.1 hypothetical protein [Burkholderia multivorans]